MKKEVLSNVVSYFACFLLSCASSCEDCLMLTPYIRNGSASLARNLASVNPKHFLDIESYSGYITVKHEYNSNLFFWFFPVADMQDKPWLIWLQGGPGVSSMFGLFEMIGPIKIEDGRVELRDITWASDYSLLFLDNPVGAGFSFTDNDSGYPNNEDDVGAQMYEFLQQFLQMFPELRLAPLFLAGQSYAGKYVPALGIQIHRHRNATHPINIKGFSIGNGLIDLRSMMRYSDLCGALGFLDGEDLWELKHLEQSVVQLIDANRMVDASNKFNETIEFIKNKSLVNIYNFLKDPDNTTPPFEAFIKTKDVRRWIHAGNATFDLNNQLVYEKMLPDIADTTKPWVEELLDHYPVMSYSGQLDIILPYNLSKHTYRLLDWSRVQEYRQAKRKPLRNPQNGAVLGYTRSGGNFVEVLIRGAGHNVPADVPETAKYVIDLFIRNYKW